MKVSIVSKDLISALFIAKEFDNSDNQISVLGPPHIERINVSRTAEEWNTYAHDVKIMTSPNEIIPHQPDLIINLDPIMGTVTQKLVHKLSQNKKVLSVGCSVMNHTLESNLMLGMTFLENSMSEIHPYKKFEKQTELNEYLLIQDRDSPFTIETQNKTYYTTNMDEYLSSPLPPGIVGATSFIVREEVKPEIIKLGLFFNGTEIIGNPFFIKETDKTIFIHHTLDNVNNIIPHLPENLTKIFRAIGFVGVVFLSINTRSMRIRSISTKTHPLFWVTFCKSLGQNFGHYLFSLSKGVKFIPEIQQNAFGYFINQNTTHLPVKSLPSPILDNRYIAGDGDVVGYFVGADNIPSIKFTGYGLLNLPDICNHPNVIAQACPFYYEYNLNNDPSFQIISAVELLPPALSLSCVGFVSKAQPTLSSLVDPEKAKAFDVDISEEAEPIDDVWFDTPSDNDIPLDEREPIMLDTESEKQEEPNEPNTDELLEQEEIIENNETEVYVND
jgi:hypothetical protein